MACFLVSAAEAVVVTAVEKACEKKELKTAESDEIEEAVSVPMSRKLRWLSYMLWGGVVLLAFEHIWHGELTMYFPFLTAAMHPGDVANMLHEISTVGVAMAGAVTGVWAVVALVADKICAASSYKKWHDRELRTNPSSEL